MIHAFICLVHKVLKSFDHIVWKSVALVVSLSISFVSSFGGALSSRSFFIKLFNGLRRMRKTAKVVSGEHGFISFFSLIVTEDRGRSYRAATLKPFPFPELWDSQELFAREG